MNYATLQTAVLDDCKAQRYAGADVQRYIAQGEALIASRLEAYNLLGQLTDTDRVSAGSSTYTLPTKLTHLRYVKIAGRPLDKVDETSAYLYKDLSLSTMYAQRATQIVISGNPGTGTAIDIDYMGMPAALAVTATNTLLDDVPQLYIDAASVYVYGRMENVDAANAAISRVLDMCKELNRKSKKLLGGAQASPVYNLDFRSSY